MEGDVQYINITTTLKWFTSPTKVVFLVVIQDSSIPALQALPVGHQQPAGVLPPCGWVW